VTFDLYVWKAPRDLDAEEAERLVQTWHEAGGDPSESPFEPTTDIGWFYRELLSDAPDLETSSDAVPRTSSLPIWLSSDDEAPARVVGIRFLQSTTREGLDNVYSLAAKYDLVLYDARNRRIYLPLEAMGAYASATFWPAGATQAAMAGTIGALLAVVAWLISIPLISGILVVIGVFLFSMAVFTFFHEGRKAIRARGTARGTLPDEHR
jgi:hypothetical protein